MLNISNCAKCNGTFFKVVTQEPSGSNFKLNFVQCSSCNTTVGVLDFFNTGSQLEDQKKQIANISSRISGIESALQQVIQMLQRK